MSDLIRHLLDRARSQTSDVVSLVSCDCSDGVEACGERFTEGLPVVVHNVPVGQPAEVRRWMALWMEGEAIRVRRSASTKAYADAREYGECEALAFMKSIMESQSEDGWYAANMAVPESTALAPSWVSLIQSYLSQLRSPRLWLGPSATGTPLHKDSTDNFSLQLIGSKKWLLYSIHDLDALRLERTKYGGYQHPLASFEVAREAAPAAAHVTVTCSPGDMLFVPFGWAHAVVNESISAMMNWWFDLDGYVPLVLRNCETSEKVADSTEAKRAG